MFAEDKWHESEKIIMDNGDKHENSLICTLKMYEHWNAFIIEHWAHVRVFLHEQGSGCSLYFLFFSSFLYSISVSVSRSSSISSCHHLHHHSLMLWHIKTISTSIITDKFIPDVIYTFELIILNCMSASISKIQKGNPSKNLVDTNKYTYRKIYIHSHIQTYNNNRGSKILPGDVVFTFVRPNWHQWILLSSHRKLHKKKNELFLFQ